MAPYRADTALCLFLFFFLSSHVYEAVLCYSLWAFFHFPLEQAYRSYLLAYSSHSLKDIYDVHELDLQDVARAFGFTVPPRVSTLL